jgi:type IV secretion system protein VirB4
MKFDFANVVDYLHKIKNLRNSKKKANAPKNHDFIPFVSHYNEDTIITKNGELIQIIRVVGYNNSSILHELINLRDAVRFSLRDSIKSNYFAIWITTIRRRKNISPDGDFNDYFSQKIDDFWQQENNWQNDFINELYISIIIEGFDTSITNIKSLISSCFYFTTKLTHQYFLEKSRKKLDEITDFIVKYLNDHGARKLSIVEWNGVIYSEHMRFFGKICNLQEKYYPLTSNEICEDISQNRIFFGGRQIEVNSHLGKSFAAILSLKEYFDINIKSLDKVLQLPCEFIISQSFDFFFNKKFLDEKKEQYEMLELSDSLDFARAIGLDNYIKFANEKDIEEQDMQFGKMQTNIMVINNNLNNLENDIKLISEKFREIGVPIIREDIFLEHCFWSQLPANFIFLKRQKIAPLSYFATFSALHSFSSGRLNGNAWGPAITTFKTIMHNPYFFNFHSDKNGNTIIIGNESSGKRVLINFLLTQAKRIPHRLFYFDHSQNNLCFIKALHGENFVLNKNPLSTLESVLQLNPLFLEDNNSNHRFLSDFIFAVLKNDSITEDYKTYISQKIDIIISGMIRNFYQVRDIFSEDKDLFQAFNKLDRFYDIFNNSHETVLDNLNIAFNLSDIFGDNNLLELVIQYLFHRINIIATDNNSIVVFRYDPRFFANNVIKNMFLQFCDDLNKKNSLVIMIVDDEPEFMKDWLVRDFVKKARTQIIGSVTIEEDILRNIINFSEDEIKIIPYIKDQPDKTFLIRNIFDSLFVNFELKNHLPILKILSSSAQDLAIAEELLANTTSDEWIDQFFDIINILEEERLTEIKNKQKEDSIKRAKLSKASRYID